MFNLVNSTKHKIYLGTGLGLNFSSFPDNTLTETNQFASPAYRETDNYLAFEKRWISMHARVGYFFNKRIELAGVLKYGGSFENYSYFNFKTPINGVTVNYHF